MSDNIMGVLFLTVGEHGDHDRGTLYSTHVASEAFVVQALPGDGLLPLIDIYLQSGHYTQHLYMQVGLHLDLFGG